MNRRLLKVLNEGGEERKWASAQKIGGENGYCSTGFKEGAESTLGI